MKFEYYDKDFGRQVSRANFSYWVRTTGKMREDLSRFAAGDVTESEAREYLADMTGYLRKPRNICGGVLYLMYDEPSEMPADARVEFVYTPTYLAAAIAVTAMNRFESLMEDAGLCRAIRALLCGSTGRRFQGAGYDGDIGLMDALEIFGEGDTMEFLGGNPDFCPEFTVRFREAVEYLQNEICTGKVTNAWTGKDYAQRGKTVLAKLLGGNGADVQV